jgi:hypothetical protein
MFHITSVLSNIAAIIVASENNEAIFQLITLVYNLFLLFKVDFAKGTEYRLQIKAIRLMYFFSGREDHPDDKECGYDTF